LNGQTERWTDKFPPISLGHLCDLQWWPKIIYFQYCVIYKYYLNAKLLHSHYLNSLFSSTSVFQYLNILQHFATLVLIISCSAIICNNL